MTRIRSFTSPTVLLGACLSLCLAFPGYANEIGVAESVSGDVQGLLLQASRELESGDSVFANELIETEDDGRTELRFLDETQLSIGPNAQVRLDRFVYDPAGGNGSMLIHLGVGAMRFTSGRMQSGAYEVKTPVASIGIRGTMFDVIVAATGATTVILYEGIIELFTGVGSVILDQPGQSSTAEEAEENPSAPADATDELRDEVEELGDVPASAAERPDLHRIGQPPVNIPKPRPTIQPNQSHHHPEPPQSYTPPPPKPTKPPPPSHHHKY